MIQMIFQLPFLGLTPSVKQNCVVQTVQLELCNLWNCLELHRTAWSAGTEAGSTAWYCLGCWKMLGGLI